MLNSQVQETMLLLAEAHTVNNEPKQALSFYEEILDARDGGFGEGEPKKDIFRKMAPLQTQLGNYTEAASSL